VNRCGRGLLRGLWWPIGPTLFFGHISSKSPGNYGGLFVYVVHNLMAPKSSPDILQVTRLKIWKGLKLFKLFLQITTEKQKTILCSFAIIIIVDVIYRPLVLKKTIFRRVDSLTPLGGTYSTGPIERNGLYLLRVTIGNRLALYIGPN
jgi:hypothetical protein